MPYGPPRRDVSPNQCYGTSGVPPLPGFIAAWAGPSVCRWGFLTRDPLARSADEMVPLPRD
jgi:hypothetical protein